jgi:hypothetical protein
MRKSALPRQEDDRHKFMQKLQEALVDFQKELQSIDADIRNFFTYNDLEQAEEYAGQVSVCACVCVCVCMRNMCAELYVCITQH